VYPVHEILIPDRIEETQEGLQITVDHKADQTKSRGQYLPLLALSVQEDKSNDRNSFYYARELYFYNRYPEAIEEFKRYLSLPKAVWAAERAAAMRYIALMVEHEHEKEEWLYKAIGEAPDRREAYVQIAELFYNRGMWTACSGAAQRALEIIEKPLEYLCESWAWNERPYDYVAFCNYKLALTEKEYQEKSGDDRSEHINHYLDKAVKFGAKAVELNPNDARLRANLRYYLEEQGGNDIQDSGADQPN
jgi:tetratricopeptide (TPR) repeat protein